MKYKIKISIAAFVLLLASCTAIEDRAPMGPVLAANQLKVAVIQKTAGSNSITVVNSTPGTIMYWDWGTGTGHSASLDDSVSFYVPFKGTFKLKYTALCAGGTVTDSVTYTVAANDNAYFDTDPVWKGLTAGGAGQTWVFATDVPGGNVGGNGPVNSPGPAWWNLDASASGIGSQLKAPWSVNDQIYFDLVGAANMKITHADGSVTKGFFNVLTPFNDTADAQVFHAISCSGGAQFPWPNGNGIGQYHFTVLTADKLTAHDYGNYNVGVYKRLGFKY